MSRRAVATGHALTNYWLFNRKNIDGTVEGATRAFTDELVPLVKVLQIFKSVDACSTQDDEIVPVEVTQ